MKSSTLDMLINVECIMGVYRNYSLQMNFRNKRFLRVILEILAFSVIFLYGSYEFLLQLHTDHNMLNNRIFKNHIRIFLCTCIIMIRAIQTSRSYIKFINNIQAVDQYCNTENTNKCVNKFKKEFVTFTSVICFGVVYIVLSKMFYVSLTENQPPTVGSVMSLAAELFAQTRFHVEHVVFYIYIKMFHYLLKRLNEFISDMQNCYDAQDSKFCSDRGSITNDQLIEERMAEWAKNYMLLVECSKELSTCFSSQMIFSLGISAQQFITLSFTFIRVFVENEPYKYLSAFQSILILIYYSSGTCLVLVAGQRLINEDAKTIRGLLKLNNTLLIYAQSKSKTVKDTYLLVKANPIKIEYTGRVLQGTYLIPIILSLSVNYVIVTLQINHII